MQYYPNNTLANYVTKLPQVIDLSNEWECGLYEILFPISWYNVHESDRWMQVSMAEESEIKIYDISPPCGYYTSPQELVNSINEQLFIAEDEWSTDSSLVRFKYNELTKKVSIRFDKSMDNPISVMMTPNMAELLGFELEQHMMGKVADQTIQYNAIQLSYSGTSMFAADQGGVIRDRIAKMHYDPATKIVQLKSGVDKSYVGSRVCDLRRGFQSMFVYCDIVEHVIVGDHKVPLLRTVDASGSEGSVVNRIYQTVQYVPLQRRQFDTIEISIKDDTGATIPFQNGRVIVTLHFRMRKSFYI